MARSSNSSAPRRVVTMYRKDSSNDISKRGNSERNAPATTTPNYIIESSSSSNNNSSSSSSSSSDSTNSTTPSTSTPPKVTTTTVSAAVAAKTWAVEKGAILAKHLSEDTATTISEFSSPADIRDLQIELLEWLLLSNDVLNRDNSLQFIEKIPSSVQEELSAHRRVSDNSSSSGIGSSKDASDTAYENNGNPGQFSDRKHEDRSPEVIPPTSVVSRAVSSNSGLYKPELGAVLPPEAMIRVADSHIDRLSHDPVNVAYIVQASIFATLGPTQLKDFHRAFVATLVKGPGTDRNKPQDSEGK